MSRYTLTVLVLALVACAPNRGPYAPVQTTGAEVPGKRVVAYSVPPDSPRGAVRLATLGLTRLLATEQRAVHLRMVVANRSGAPWTIRQAEQRLELSTGEQLYPTSPTGEPVPVVEVAPRTTATLDLFFPLPPRMQDTREMEAFTAVWTVHLDAVVVTERSAFEGFRTADLDETVPTEGDPFNTPVGPGRVPSAGVP